MADGKIARLAFEQRDPMRARLDLAAAAARHARRRGRRARRCGCRSTAPSREATEAVGKPAPAFVLPNGGGWAYGDFVLDPASLDYLSRSLPDIADPLTRGSAWVTLWDDMLDGRVPPAAFIDLAAAALPRETDEQTDVARARLRCATRGGASSAPPSARERAATLEQLLRDGLTAPRRASQKSAWFGALRDVALTRADGRVAAAGVGARTRAVPGLPLAEADYTTLALELAVREVAGWKDDSADAARAHREPGSQGALPVRDAGALRRPGRARHAGSARSPTSTTGGASRGCSKASATCTTRCAPRRRPVRPAEPRAAAGDPADRRHLLPEALDGRDARRPQLARSGGRRCASSSRRCPRTIRSGCGTSRCSRRTNCSAPKPC